MNIYLHLPFNFRVVIFFMLFEDFEINKKVSGMGMLIMNMEEQTIFCSFSQQNLL